MDREQITIFEKVDVMRQIECLNTKNEKVLIDVDRFTFRPSAYGIVVHENKVLLLPTKSTGKYFLPGGGIDPGERAVDTVKREVVEESGLMVEIDKFEFVNERFFYFDQKDLAWQVYGFVYTCH